MQNVRVGARNKGLDFLKYVCAFLVICIHTDFPGQVYADALARIAVPVFFMITGFYYTDIQNRGKQKSQIKKILTIALLSNLLYMGWEFVTEGLLTGTPLQTLRSWMDAEKWFRFLVLNDSPFCSRLWYLGALLYVLVLAAMLEKAGLLRKLYILIPVLLVGNLVLGNYSAAIWGRTLPLAYSRNFLLAGLPCFLLGDWLRQNFHKIKCPNGVLVAVALAAGVLTLLEREWLAHHFATFNKDLYASTMIAATAVFVLVNRNAAWFEHGVLSKIALWGRDLSLGIYIYNRLVRIVLYKAIEILTRDLPQVEAVLQALSPVIVLAAASVLVVCMNRIKGRIGK